MVAQAKPIEARTIEARGRAKDLGVRVFVVEPQRHYRTKSQTTGQTYNIVRTRAGWSCECPGAYYTGVCKHAAQIQRRADREGWSFGRIAPRSYNA